MIEEISISGEIIVSGEILSIVEESTFSTMVTILSAQGDEISGFLWNPVSGLYLGFTSATIKISCDDNKSNKVVEMSEQFGV